MQKRWIKYYYDTTTNKRIILEEETETGEYELLKKKEERMSKEPNYLMTLEKGDLLKKVEEAKKHITNCNLCPHKCGVNRIEEVGICKANHKAIVSSYGPHLGEESVLVGQRGSGTLFFGYCNLSCVYCQNYKLSVHGEGDIVSNERLAQMMLALQNDYGCHNINLVTPTHFVPNILEAIYLAAQNGLKLPIVYNSGGYELSLIHICKTPARRAA